MSNNQEVIDRVVNEVVSYVHTKAVDNYKAGETVKTGRLRKKEVINVTIDTTTAGTIPCFTVSNRKARLSTSEPMTLTGNDKPFLTSLKRICDSIGIIAEEHYIGRNVPHPHITFILPVEYVESYINDFSEKLKTSKRDLVIRFGNTLLSNQNKEWEDIYLARRGLYGYKRESGSPLLTFSSLGMKPLDSDARVELFAEAIIDHLNRSKADKYFIKKHETHLGLECIFRKEKTAQRKPGLSDW